MKVNYLLPAILLIIISFLISALAYEIDLRHRAGKWQDEFIIAVSVQSYQGLAQGNVEAVKRRLGALVSVQTEHYEQNYASETETNFAAMLAQAKMIQAEVAASNK